MITDHQINLFARFIMVSFYTASAESCPSKQLVFASLNVRFREKQALLDVVIVAPNVEFFRVSALLDYIHIGYRFDEPNENTK